MKETKRFNTKHASIIGITTAVALICGVAWAETDGDKIDVKKAPPPPPPKKQIAQPDQSCEVVYYSPMNELVRLEQEMDQFFGRPVSPRGRSFRREMVFRQPSMDMHEQEDAYTIKMDLPGMEKSDINIEIKDSILTISAEINKSTEQKDGDKIILQERSSGYVSRSIRLPRTVDTKNITAEHKNGVLTITLPKTENAQETQKIIIQ